MLQWLTVTIQAICAAITGIVIADHMHVKASAITLIKWDHFDILAKGKINYHCKIKETLFIQELEPAFNLNVEVRRFVPHVQLLEHFIDTFLHVEGVSF